MAAYDSDPALSLEAIRKVVLADAAHESSFAAQTARRPLANDAAVRLYGTSPCATLLIAFSALGGVRHEFVGSCKRAGISHALFLTDSKQSWFLLDNSFEDVLSACLLYTSPSPRDS